MARLTRSFYSRSALIVARELLGCILVRRVGETVLRGRIVETEAYLNDDPASHSFRGMTPRTAVMFGPAGHLYVYFTYGMHYCANVVTGKEGIGEAVLLRAVEPLEGTEVMMRNRYGPKSGRNETVLLKNLTNGPAKLAKAFALTTAHSGVDLPDTGIHGRGRFRHE